MDKQVKDVEQTEEELNMAIQKRINERMEKCNVEISKVLEKYSAELKGVPRYIQTNEGAFSLVVNIMVAPK